MMINRIIGIAGMVLICNFLGISCTSVDNNSAANVKIESASVVDYVNPLMGTDSKFSLSNGNTYPAIATPWGMNF